MNYKIPEYMKRGIEMRLAAFMDESSQEGLDEFYRRCAAVEDKSVEKQLGILLEILG